MMNHDVGPLIICLGKNSSLFAFPCRYLDNSSHHLAKGAFCDRGRTESATKSQSVTPQADVLLAAADVQLLTDQLLAHATMPPTLSLTTKRETVSLYSLLSTSLNENYQMKPLATRLLLRARVISQGQVTAELRADTRGMHSSNFPASDMKRETVRADMVKK